VREHFIGYALYPEEEAEEEEVEEGECALVISNCKPGGLTLYCINLFDAFLCAGAPYAGCILYGRSY
jgi:hypothetical protein